MPPYPSNDGPALPLLLQHGQERAAPKPPSEASDQMRFVVRRQRKQPAYSNQGIIQRLERGVHVLGRASLLPERRIHPQESADGRGVLGRGTRGHQRFVGTLGMVLLQSHPRSALLPCVDAYHHQGPRNVDRIAASKS